MTQLSRRRILELLGLAGTGYLASSLGRKGPVRAAGATIPKRLVFFYTDQGSLKQFNSNGTLKPFWAPTAVGAPDPLKILAPWSTNTFTMGDMHQPLLPYQKQLLFLDGLDMISASVDPTDAENAHTAGETHTLTAVNRQSPTLAGGISIDQFIAKGINSPSPATVLPSLEIFIDEEEGQTGGTPLYAASGQPLPITGKASILYGRMFPNGAPSTSAADQAKLAMQIAQQKSVLDYAATDFSNLAQRMGKLDAARLNAHAAAIRDLENRLSLGSNTSCVPPNPSIVNAASQAGNATAYRANVDVLLHLAQTALACDLTRVATVYLSQAPDQIFGYVPNMSGTTDFHDMVHQTNGVAAQGKTVPPLGDDPQAMATVKAYHAYNSSVFATFLGLLQAIPESDGTTLLDNTLVVWCGQLAGGDHSLERIPYILAGGLGATVNTGRYVLLPRKVAGNTGPAYSTGLPHNNLFVSLANLMGLPTTTFGNPSVCTGPLNFG